MGAKQPSQTLAGIILAGEPDEHRPPAQRGDIASHVAGAARHFPDIAQADHRHRRLRRNALDIAMLEPVQNDIAYAQNSQLGEIHAPSNRTLGRVAQTCSRNAPARWLR
jgi:hypothetical protein